MPELSRFYGIVVGMYYREHGVPHFHARLAEHDASIAIEDLSVLEGSLPPRALRLVREWAALHRVELEQNWRRARAEDPLSEIDPLP